MRYAQLLSPGVHATEPVPATARPGRRPPVVPFAPVAPAPGATAPPRGIEARMEAVERELKDLRETVAGLLAELG